MRNYNFGLLFFFCFLSVQLRMLHLTTLNSFVQLLNHNFAERIEHAGHVDGQVGKLELTQNYPEFPLPVVLDCSQIQLRHVYC